MKKKWYRYFIVFILLFCCTGCDIKGANNPYSYAPQSSNTIWQPPPKAQTRLLVENLEKEIEDYHTFSKESPFTLGEIIDIALSTSPETKESWAAARISAAEYGQSLQNNFILAEVDGNYSRTRSLEFLDKRRDIIYETQYGGQLELSYRILDFGQTRMSSEAALQSLYNADWSHNSKIQTIIQTMMNDYYNYLYQQHLLFSIEQDVVNAQVSLDATEKKFQQGLADISDIVQAKTSYLQQKLNIVNQKKNLHVTYTKLVNDMGLPANDIFYFEGYPEKIISFDIDTLDKLIIKANEYRPDLLAEEARVKSSIASFKASRLKKFPIVTGEFDVGRKYYQHGITDTYDFSAQINLTFPIFQGFYLDNSIKLARANLEKSEAQLKQVKLSIIQEVSNYRNDVIYAQESIKYAKDYLESAEEDYRVNLKKYNVGTGTIVNLINAQTAVADARAQLAESQFDWYSSIANLAYATGILFPPMQHEINPYIQTIENKENHL